MAVEYLASNEFPANGVQTDWEVSFKGNRPDAGSGTTPYLNSADVHAQEITPATQTTPEVVVDKTCVAIAPNVFRVTPVAANGHIVRIYRATQDEYNLVDYKAKQTVTEADLDLSNTQTLYIVQEASDTATRAGADAGNAVAIAYSAITEAELSSDLAEQALSASATATAVASNAVSAASTATNTANAASLAAAAATAAAGTATSAANAATAAAAAVSGTAADAVTTANAAQSTANAAQTTANGVDAKATSALAASASAAADASTALTTANSIAATANAASAQANDATNIANSAVTTANAVDAKAQTALDNSASATSTANSAASAAAAAATAAAAKAVKGANNDITSLSALTTAITIAQGGTGATTAKAARTALAVAPQLPNFITGLILRRSAASTIKVSVGAAVIQSSGVVLEASTELTITLSGLTALTLYHVYLYSNAGAAAVELSATAPTPAAFWPAFTKTGDTSRRYLGSIMASSATDCWLFNHSESGDMQYNTNQLSNTRTTLIAAGRNTSGATVSCAGMLPAGPAYELRAMVVNNIDTAVTMSVTNSDQGLPGNSNYNLLIGYTTGNSWRHEDILLDSVGAFSYAAQGSGSTGGLYVTGLGYKFRR